MLRPNIAGAGKPQLLFKLIGPATAHQHLKRHQQQRKGRKRSRASDYDKLFIQGRAPLFTFGINILPCRTQRSTAMMYFCNLRIVVSFLFLNEQVEPCLKEISRRCSQMFSEARRHTDSTLQNSVSITELLKHQLVGVWFCQIINYSYDTIHSLQEIYWDVGRK